MKIIFEYWKTIEQMQIDHKAEMKSSIDELRKQNQASTQTIVSSISQQFETKLQNMEYLLNIIVKNSKNNINNNNESSTNNTSNNANALAINNNDINKQHQKLTIMIFQKMRLNL